VEMAAEKGKSRSLPKGGATWKFLEGTKARATCFLAAGSLHQPAQPRANSPPPLRVLLIPARFHPRQLNPSPKGPAGICANGMCQKPRKPRPDQTIVSGPNSRATCGISGSAFVPNGHSPSLMKSLQCSGMDNCVLTLGASTSRLTRPSWGLSTQHGGQ
jgi:hypothetical protein